MLPSTLHGVFFAKATYAPNNKRPTWLNWRSLYQQTLIGLSTNWMANGKNLHCAAKTNRLSPAKLIQMIFIFGAFERLLLGYVNGNWEQLYRYTQAVLSIQWIQTNIISRGWNQCRTAAHGAFDAIDWCRWYLTTDAYDDDILNFFPCRCRCCLLGFCQG